MVLEKFDDVFPQLPKPRLSRLAKTKQAIIAGATGKVELSDIGGVLFGGDFQAKNVSDTNIATDKFIHLGEASEGFAFFRPGGAAAPECGAGDCPDSCIDFPLCFDVSWSIFGGSFGIFTVPVTIDPACIQFQAPASNPNGFGSVDDPITGRAWTLTVEWDACAGIILYTLEDCDGIPVPIDEILGGTISAPACSLDIDILITPAGGQPCVLPNLFPCCDPLEGCTCG